MKKLLLTKTQINTKSAKWHYQVIEAGKVIAERKSDREYVACYIEYRPASQWHKEGYYMPFCFGRADLIGKGSSKGTEAGMYALAVL